MLLLAFWTHLGPDPLPTDAVHRHLLPQGLYTRLLAKSLSNAGGYMPTRG